MELLILIDSQQTSVLELLLVCYFCILLAYHCTLYHLASYFSKAIW